MADKVSTWEMEVDEIIAFHHYQDKKKKEESKNKRKKKKSKNENEDLNDFDELFESDYFLLQ